MNITEIVKNNVAQFSFYRNGKLYYRISTPEGSPVCEFPIDITDENDIGNAVFMPSFKAITLMRYIRKSISLDQLVMLTGA